MGAGGAQPNISQQLIRQLIIPIPTLREQTKIIDLLASFDDKLEINSNKKSKLLRIKQGLMQQLLTGKKRVKVDESEEVLS